MVHMDIALKTCRTVPIIIFYDIVMFQGNRFGQFWIHFVRYNGWFDHWMLLCRVYYLVRIICNLGKYTWELLISYHLAVTNVGNGTWGYWVLQGMGQFVRRDDEIFWGRIVREWSIVWVKFNTVSVTLSSCFINIHTMAPIVIHGKTKIPSSHSMWWPSYFHCWFFIDNYLCSRRS